MAKHRHKSSRAAKAQKPLIRQCVWCKKVLKTGDYLTEGKAAFCSPTCLTEWKTRQSIVKRELDGQNRSSLFEQRLKAHGLVGVMPAAPGVTEGSAPAVTAPEAPPAAHPVQEKPLPDRREIIRGMTVAEFLDGRTDEEIEKLAEQFTARRARPWLNAYNIALAALAIILVVIIFATFRKKERYYAIALENKHKIETLKKKVESLVATTVPVDTAGLLISFPSDGQVQNGRTVNVRGSVQDSMALTLIVNNSIRAQRRVPGGPFEFYDVSLNGGDNNLAVKGVDADNKVYSRSVRVSVPEKAAGARRNINYDGDQAYVPNQYPDNLNYSRGNPNKKQIALTFDGGSHVGEAQNILDTLKSRGIKATFFITGEFAERHVGLLRQIIADGHVLGNHSWDHPHLTSYASDATQTTLPGVTREFLQEELRKTSRLFEELGLPATHLWRAPYGEQNRALNAWAEEAGYKHIGWTQGTSWRTNLDTNDWVEHPGEAGFFYPDEVVRKILSFGKGTPYGLNGGIVLMHIGTLRKDFPFYQKIGALIDTLKASGYRFVTVPEMMANE